MAKVIAIANQKGGVGKTWLLRRCAELAKQSRQDLAVVMVDFFYIGDRDSVFLAEKIITGLQELYPTWTPTAFKEATQRIRSQTSASVSTENVGTQVWAALAEDLRHLDREHLTQEKKMLLVLFDTF